jgi:hypothetical protein
MLEHLKTQNPVELEKKLETAIEVATLHHIDAGIIHAIREEVESLRFMAPDIKNRVMSPAIKKITASS